MPAEFKFRASDAFVYVDTYRREILHPIARVQADLNRVREQGLGPSANLSPTRYYAELRALEHAFNFVQKREEPNVVVLGEDGVQEVEMTDAHGNKVTKNAKQLITELGRCEEHGQTLEIALKQVKGREHELQAELVARDQHIQRMQVRLANNQATVTVLTATLAITVIVMLMVVFL